MNRRAVATVVWSLLAVAFEIYVYVAYGAHEARFHWFTHFFVGGSAALLVMALVTYRTRRPAPVPVVWPVLGHLIAMFPDFLFSAGIAHQRWMDLFVVHLSTHFIPGRNWTWFAVFLATLAAYLAVLELRVPAGRSLIHPADAAVLGRTPKRR